MARNSLKNKPKFTFFADPPPRTTLSTGNTVIIINMLSNRIYVQRWPEMTKDDDKDDHICLWTRSSKNIPQMQG